MLDGPASGAGGGGGGGRVAGLGGRVAEVEAEIEALEGCVVSSPGYDFADQGLGIGNG